MTEAQHDHPSPRADGASRAAHPRGAEAAGAVHREAEPWSDRRSLEEADAALELAARLGYLERRADVLAARSEVLAARRDLAAETVRLEASARAALDVPAMVRRAPGKAAGVASGAAFLLLGGPGRVVRGIRRAVFGPDADLPKSMLPDQVEKELRKLGSDGKRVRAVLEREFTRYLDEKADLRRERDLPGTLASLAGNVLRPASVRAGRRLVEELFEPDSAGGSGSGGSRAWVDAVARARERAAHGRAALDGQPAKGREEDPQRPVR
jgi:hypothetical protein